LVGLGVLVGGVVGVGVGVKVAVGVGVDIGTQIGMPGGRNLDGSWLMLINIAAVVP
jgi:hypothetical protein